MHNPLPKDKSFSFPLACVLLKVVGAWPLSQSNPPSAIGIIYLFWSLCMIVMIALTCLAQSMYFVAEFGDVLAVADCGCTVFMGCHILLRLVHLSIQRGSLKRLITNFVNHIWISKETDKSTFERCETEMVPVKCIAVLQFVLIWMYVLGPLYELFMAPDAHNKPFPYRMKFPYDANHGLKYVFTYTLTSVAGMGVVYTLLSEDTLFAFFMTYTCGQFRLLHKSIDNIICKGQELANKRYPDDDKDSLVHNARIQREYRELLIKIIKHHNVVIQFHDDLQAFFSPILLINYIASSLLICVIGIQIIAVKLTFVNLAKLVVYILSALSQLFVLCWKGDGLIEISTMTALKLYSCNWQGKSTDRMFEINHDKIDQRTTIKLKNILDCPVEPRFLKDLTFVIKRSQKPLIITAAKFSVLSLSSFSKILSTSMSYFTLLQSLVEESK